jgi:DNA-binding transcriptional LysR family regulator
MELRYLQYFCEAAKYQHFSKAAEALFISQPALSKTIKNLEAELGVPLFEASGRSVQLTPYGKYFYEVVSHVLDELNTATQKLREVQTASSTAISIVNEVPELFAHFTRSLFYDHPELQIMESPMRPEFTKSREFASATYVLSYSTYHLNGVVSRELLQDRFLVLVQEGLPISKKSSVPLQELHGFRHVGNANIRLPMPLEQALPYPDYLVSDLMSVIRLVSQGYGVAVIPESSWYYLQPTLDTVFAVDTRPVPVVLDYVAVPLYLSYPDKSSYLPHEQTFLDFTNQFFEELQWELTRFAQNGLR